MMDEALVRIAGAAMNVSSPSGFDARGSMSDHEKWTWDGPDDDGELRLPPNGEWAGVIFGAIGLFHNPYVGVVSVPFAAA